MGRRGVRPCVACTWSWARRGGAARVRVCTIVRACECALVRRRPLRATFVPHASAPAVRLHARTHEAAVAHAFRAAAHRYVAVARRSFVGPLMMRREEAIQSVIAVASPRNLFPLTPFPRSARSHLNPPIPAVPTYSRRTSPTFFLTPIPHFARSHLAHSHLARSHLGLRRRVAARRHRRHPEACAEARQRALVRLKPAPPPARDAAAPI